MAQTKQSKIERSLKIVSRSVAALAVAVGLLVLLGWALDAGALKSVLPGLVTMKANTALAFALCGTSLWLMGSAACTGRYSRLWFARICAVVVALIGLLTVCEYAFGWELGIDQLLFRDADTIQTSHPGRPSPATAFNFVLLGAALLLMEAETRGKVRPAQWLALFVLFDGLVAILGYAYGVAALYRVGAYSSMALHTAVLFSLLPFGLLCARPEGGWMGLITADGPGGMLVRRLLPMAILVPPVVGGLWLAGERAGFYPFEFGLAIFAISNVVIFSGLVWWTSRSVQRMDVERKRLEAANEQLARIVRFSDDAIIGMGLDGIIASWNKGAEQIFGYSASEMIGTSTARLIPDDRRGEETRIIARIKLNEKVEHYETVWRSKDGRLMDVSLTASAIKDSTDKIIGSSTVIRDITEQKKNQEELKRSNEALEQSNMELVHAARLATAGELTASIAHELSQPLCASLQNTSAAQLILQSASPDLEELRAIAADIRADNRRAADVIGRLRLLLKRGVFESQSLDIPVLVAEVEAFARPDAARRRVQIETDVPPDLPLVEGDRVHLQQVLLNLILNAMDALNNGVSERRVSIGARMNANQMVELSVSDTGHGIPPENMQHVFEPYFTTKAKGMGLGLPLSRRLIEAHGGRMWVEDNFNGGATFRFTLKVAPQEKHQTISKAS